MTDIEILEDIKKIITKQFGILEEDIEENSYFDQDLNVTELEMEDLVAQVEEKYNVKILPETIPSFKKVSDLVDYLYENAEVSV